MTKHRHWLKMQKSHPTVHAFKLWHNKYFKEMTEIITVRNLCGGAMTALLLLTYYFKLYNNVECFTFKSVVRL